MRLIQRAIALMTSVALLVGYAAPLVVQTIKPVQAVEYFPLNENRAKDFAIVKKDGVWHVFAIYCKIYEPCANYQRGLMHLTSTDLTNWTEVGYILTPDGGSDFDDFDIWAPSIVEKDGTYYMFYTGVSVNGYSKWVQMIGLATSTDLTTWTKYSTSPVFDCSTITGVYSDPTDDVACRDPYVFWDETEHQWVMSVSSRRTGSTPANLMSIALATSDDLTTWSGYGFITASDDYAAESSHVFQHNNTYYMFYTNGGEPAEASLEYLTSSDLYSGWTRIGDPPSVGVYEYASEYYKDGDREYFMRASNNNVSLDFDQITWPSDVFTVSEIPYATIGDYVWNDVDGDGVPDAGEAGIDSVIMRLYLDNGDGVFNVSSDDVYSTATTGDDPNTVGTQHGYYAFTTALPGSTYWLTVDPSNYNSGGALASMANTTDNTVVSLAPTDSQSLLTHDMGFQAKSATWSLSTAANFTVGSNLTLTGGRVAPTPLSASASPAWWNTDYRYRKQVTVSAVTQNLDNTKTVVLNENLTTLISAGKLQSDYDDLRLVYWNGAANTEVDLDVIDATTQRFKVQASVTAGNSDGGYYLYYGDPKATYKPARLASVYDYYSSFNAPNGTTYGSWQEGGGNWQIVGNAWEQLTTSTGGFISRDTSKVVNLSQNWASEVSLKIKSTGNTRIGGIVFHSSQQALGGDSYFVNLQATSPQRIRFFRTVSDQNFFDATNRNKDTTINQDVDFVTRLEYDYNSSSLIHYLTSYINNTLIATTTETIEDGLIGCDIWYDGGCPTTDKQANFALSTFEGDVVFNDLKGWQLHDGTFTIGSETDLYPVVTSTIQPKATQATTFFKLNSFSASSYAQGGSVQYVLSNDGGTAWLYWNGTSWTASDSSLTQSNTVSQLNTNAASFPTGSGLLLWKAVMVSSSNSYPVLLHAGVTVNTVPATPTLISPAGGASVTTFTPAFTFSATDAQADALQYQLQIDTVSTFDSASLVTYLQASSQTGWSGQDQGSGTSYSSGTAASFTPTTALGNGTYYWRARAFDPNGSSQYGSYSVSRSFTTPAALTLTTPVAAVHGLYSMLITWTSSNAGSSTVEYGITASYGSTVNQADSATNHEVAVTDVVPGITYHYRVKTTDGYGQTATSTDQAFTLSPTIIRNVSVTKNTPNSVTITWTTNESATSRIRYGTTSAYGTEASNSVPDVNHSFTLNNLTPKTTYHYQLVSTGSTVTTGEDLTFTSFPEWVGRAIGPTLFTPILRNDEEQKLIILGIAKGKQTIRIYVDGKVVSSLRTPGPSSATKPFSTELSVRRFAPGKHTLYAQSTDHVGRTSIVRQRFTFTVRSRGGSKTVLFHGAVRYMVNDGDTLWAIAERYLGNGALYTKLIEANKKVYSGIIANPSVIQPGWILMIL
ncbi:MAG: family 43 glycosylhydrolase [Candidatus Kerfeldbacteria bacterium]